MGQNNFIEIKQFTAAEEQMNSGMHTQSTILRNEAVPHSTAESHGPRFKGHTPHGSVTHSSGKGYTPERDSTAVTGWQAWRGGHKLAGRQDFKEVLGRRGTQTPTHMLDPRRLSCCMLKKKMVTLNYLKIFPEGYTNNTHGLLKQNFKKIHMLTL